MLEFLCINVIMKASELNSYHMRLHKTLTSHHFCKAKNRSGAGFTLIELLVVITVIGLLSSMILVGLQGVRAQGRDTRRVSDMRNMQNALELYFNKNTTYPVGSGWSVLGTALPDVGVKKLSIDPLNRAPYQYTYVSSPDGLHYVLKAVLEDINSSALKDSLKDTEIPTGVSSPGCNPPSYCIGL